MDILGYVFICIVGFLVIVLTIIYGIILSNNTFYCYRYYNKEVKIYNNIIKCPINTFKLDYNINNFYTFNCTEYPEYSINLVSTKTEQYAFISDKKTNDCIANSFYKRGSNKLYKKLLPLLY